MVFEYEKEVALMLAQPISYVGAHDSRTGRLWLELKRVRTVPDTFRHEVELL